MEELGLGAWGPADSAPALFDICLARCAGLRCGVACLSCGVQGCTVQVAVEPRQCGANHLWITGHVPLKCSSLSAAVQDSCHGFHFRRCDTPSLTLSCIPSPSLSPPPPPPLSPPPACPPRPAPVDHWAAQGPGSEPRGGASHLGGRQLRGQRAGRDAGEGEPTGRGDGSAGERGGGEGGRGGRGVGRSLAN